MIKTTPATEREQNDRVVLADALYAYNNPKCTTDQRIHRLERLRRAARVCGWPKDGTQSVVYWAARHLIAHRVAANQNSTGEA